MIQVRINRTLAVVILTAAFVAIVPACGGSSTSDNGGLGQPHSLSLVNFLQSGVDNLPLNSVLEFTFSEVLDPSTLMSASGAPTGALQIRRGPDYGETAPGTLVVMGNVVKFYPVLPSLCDLSDAGFVPGTSYRVTVVGYPEEFSVKNIAGQPLDKTSTYEFLTLPETDPNVLQDQNPTSAPGILSTLPVGDSPAITVDDLNEVVVEFTENIDPCSINTDTVRFNVYQIGDRDTFAPAPNGNVTGFVPAEKQGSDAFSWGSTNNVTDVNPPQLIPASIVLQQTNDATELRVRPTFGQFPENSLIVLELTFGIRDFGGLPLTNTTISFTTENLTGLESSLTVAFDDTTPVFEAQTTADINTVRAPGRAQGFLLFAGDGDNGGLTLPANQIPSYPDASALPECEWRPNSGIKTRFDPVPPADILLDTGSSRNTICTNNTDGSYGVVWEFSSFRIRSGVTVTITGQNPALLLVQGDVVIQSGGRLVVRGNAGTSGQGYVYPKTPAAGKGGKGVAGSGPGGNAVENLTGTGGEGKDGWAGYSSPDYSTPEEEGGHGAGEGAPGAKASAYTGAPAAAGGGGGHATEGGQGGQAVGPSVSFNGDKEGKGGGIYPDDPQAYKMYEPSAGSGGGGGGSWMGVYISTYYSSPGGGGGAGGGFVDITAGGSIYVYGEITAAGGRGGSGGAGYYGGGGGGGGGSGGGIRLLTPNDIDITGGTISAAGGSGGTGAKSAVAQGVANNGGKGGSGRLVFEDSDSVLTGFASATLSPSEGQDGFYRGTFEATRFQGGGLNPVAVTGWMFVGPTCPPVYHAPLQEDFIAAITLTGGRGVGSTAMLVELQGYPLLPDGTADLANGSGWYTSGHFISGIAGAQWKLGNPVGGDPDFTVPPSDNQGNVDYEDLPLNVGPSQIDGYGYIQIRINYYLPSDISATEAGPYIDNWDMKFSYDQ